MASPFSRLPLISMFLGIAMIVFPFIYCLFVGFNTPTIFSDFFFCFFIYLPTVALLFGYGLFGYDSGCNKTKQSNEGNK